MSLDLNITQSGYNRQSPIFLSFTKSSFQLSSCKCSNFPSFLDNVPPFQQQSFPIQQALTNNLSFINGGVSSGYQSLPALYLSGTYQHKTSSDPLSLQTPRQPTINDCTILTLVLDRLSVKIRPCYRSYANILT